MEQRSYQKNHWTELNTGIIWFPPEQRKHFMLRIAWCWNILQKWRLQRKYKMCWNLFLLLKKANLSWFESKQLWLLYSVREIRQALKRLFPRYGMLKLWWKDDFCSQNQHQARSEKCMWKAQLPALTSTGVELPAWPFNVENSAACASSVTPLWRRPSLVFKTFPKKNFRASNN